ncbi:MAG: hypothetical protein FWD03_09325, partial [Defluviitaleaceae bacterium]|nr:hypothetical protein [Defluviitaleaceae bacterium]
TYPDASVVTYTHNRDNQILTIRDRDGGITRNVYDSYGRLDRQYLPNGGHTEFSYNGLNQITMQREIFNARITRQFTYAYDVTGLLQHETIQFFGVDNEDTSRMLRYDANGRLYLTTDTLMGRVEYDYDSMGNLIRENRAGVVTTFTYNAMNQLVSRTAPTGQYTYTYDRRGNLISESRGGVPVRTFEFDALGRMIRGTNELGETSAYEYNALNLRVANVQHLLPGHEGGHGWDVNGYLTDEPNSPGSRYIDVNRQALAGLPATAWLDALDGYEWDVEVLRDIETVRNAEGGVPYSHQRIFKDNFGLNRNSGVVRQEFVIDYVMGFNQDLMVVEAGGWETVFVYGSPLQRISQHTTKVDDIISGVPVVGGALDPHGNVAADIAVMPTYQVLYYRLDFRNSTSQMQLPNGQYIAWTGYDEWGVVTSPDSHDMNMAGVQDSIRFTSYTKDRVLGLYYAQNRWYDATTRRFTAVDPIKDGDNWYIYVGNNPVNFIDPDGLAWVNINGESIWMPAVRPQDIVRLYRTFDSQAHRVGLTNQVQVYNYRDRDVARVSFGNNTTVAQILEGAGFVDITGGSNANLGAAFSRVECNYYAWAQNKYSHHLGLTEADIERMINNFTAHDLTIIQSFGDVGSHFDAMFAVYIFNTFGSDRGQAILEQLNWAPGGGGELAHRLAERGTALFVGDFTHQQNVDAQRRQLFSAYMTQNRRKQYARPGLGVAPRRYLDEALRQQGLGHTPDNFKHTWTAGGYRYTVRIHPGDSRHTAARSIYRVSRQRIPTPGTQGTGTSYLGTDGNWHHSSTLNAVNRDGTANARYNANAARITHIPLP